MKKSTTAIIAALALGVGYYLWKAKQEKVINLSNAVAGTRG